MSQSEQDVRGIHMGARSKGCESESVRRGAWPARSEPKQGEAAPWQRVAFHGTAEPRWAKERLCGRGGGSGDERLVTYRGVDQIGKHNGSWEPGLSQAGKERTLE